MRGCWPAHLPLPLLGPAPALVSPVCELTETEHVAACLCDTRGCNGPRGAQQLARPRPRQPKQLRFPETRRQQQPGAGLKCFSCGSLFNSSSPQCDQVTDTKNIFDAEPNLTTHPLAQFNPEDNGQVARCAPGQACMLYTWKKSSTEIGSYRECFSTSIQLGQVVILPCQTCTRCLVFDEASYLDQLPRGPRPRVSAEQDPGGPPVLHQGLHVHAGLLQRGARR